MKKGQVTVFIIIGIVLLLGLGIYLYLQQIEVEEFEAALPVIEQVPAEMIPVRAFIESCVQETGKDAIKKIGNFGGYISKEKISFNPILPTEGDGIQVAPESDLVIPYWYHLKSENTCTGKCEFTSSRPELYRTPGKLSVQQQIEEHIVQNLDACINNFAEFPALKFKELEEKQVEATITRDDVQLLIRWPLEVEREGQTFKINEHATSVDVSLRLMYDLATEIANAQAEYRFLEYHAKQLIDVFGRIDSNAIPPTGELDFEFGIGQIWIKKEIEEKMQQILQSYVPMLQVGNTRNYNFIEAPENVRDPALYETIYNRNMLFVLNNTRPEIGVSFSYLDWWKPYFDMNCNGELCQSTSFSSTYLFIFGIQEYQFDYDLSFPVLVEITDPTALGGEGYSFKFFLESNMRNNVPMPSIFNALQGVPTAPESLLCRHKTSGNVTINVRDGKTGKGVDEAAIAYGCGEESCVVGVTSNGTLVTALPRCVGGIISASKSNYLTVYDALDVRNEDPMETELILEPFRKINLSINKFSLRKSIQRKKEGAVVADFDSSQWYMPGQHGFDVRQGQTIRIGNWYLDAANELLQAEDEDTTVLLERLTDDLEEPWTIVGQACGTRTSKSKWACGEPPLDVREIKLVPGKYKVKVYSFKYPEPAIVFPPQRRVVATGPLGIGDLEKVTIPPQPVVFNGTSSLPVGMAEYEWVVKKSDLDNAKRAHIKYVYVDYANIPEQYRDIEDLSQISNSLEISKANQELLEPELK